MWPGHLYLYDKNSSKSVTVHWPVCISEMSDLWNRKQGIEKVIQYIFFKFISEINILSNKMFCMIKDHWSLIFKCWVTTEISELIIVYYKIQKWLFLSAVSYFYWLNIILWSVLIGQKILFLILVSKMLIIFILPILLKYFLLIFSSNCSLNIRPR